MNQDSDARKLARIHRIRRSSRHIRCIGFTVLLAGARQLEHEFKRKHLNLTSTLTLTLTPTLTLNPTLTLTLNLTLNLNL